jgi:hypothetical protein
MIKKTRFQKKVDSKKYIININISYVKIKFTKPADEFFTFSNYVLG